MTTANVASGRAEPSVNQSLKDRERQSTQPPPLTKDATNENKVVSFVYSADSTEQMCDDNDGNDAVEIDIDGDGDDDVDDDSSVIQLTGTTSSSSASSSSRRAATQQPSLDRFANGYIQPKDNDNSQSLKRKPLASLQKPPNKLVRTDHTLMKIDTIFRPMAPQSKQATTAAKWNSEAVEAAVVDADADANANANADDVSDNNDDTSGDVYCGTCTSNNPMTIQSTGRREGSRSVGQRMESRSMNAVAVDEMIRAMGCSCCGTDGKGRVVRRRAAASRVKNSDSDASGLASYRSLATDAMGSADGAGASLNTKQYRPLTIQETDKYVRVTSIIT
jgi:hypothetical protein